MSASVAQKMMKIGLRNVYVPKGSLNALSKVGFTYFIFGELFVKGKKIN